MINQKKETLGIEKYFYRLLFRYLSVFIRPEDSVIEIDPRSFPISTFFKKSKRLFLNQDLNRNAGPADLTDLKQLAADDPEYLILNGVLHYERDIVSFFRRLHKSCNRKTRVVIVYYSSLWKPLINIASFLGLRNKFPEQNWFNFRDISNMLSLTDFEPVFSDGKILAPIYFPILSNFINRYIAPLPFFRSFCMLNIIVARPLLKNSRENLSVSVVVPARNEAGNIENLIKRVPRMGLQDEIIFVEGHSRDATWQEIQKVSEKYGGKLKIICLKQDGEGKADAVRKGFECASNDIFMILDADLSVSPEVLPDFYRAICEDKSEFINGSRMVYPHEGKAMRFYNTVGNKFFALAFSYVLNQRFKDILCGTKVLLRDDYRRIAENRSFFGEIDPFGDFDLIFGAARLGLKIIEIPITYKERSYGTTNIRRWKHGAILLKMLLRSARKIKFV